MIYHGMEHVVKFNPHLTTINHTGNVLTMDIVPYRFPGLYAIGCIFFLLNIVLFIFNVTMMSLRFRYHPSTLKASFRHPTESLFVPAAVISIGTILTNITEYGWHQGKTGPWLIDVMVVLFWIYCGVALSFTCGIYLIMSVYQVRYEERPSNNPQVVHSDIYNIANDTGLDFPRLSPFGYWTSCGRPIQVRHGE